VLWGDGNDKYLVFEGLKFTGFTELDNGDLLVQYHNLNRNSPVADESIDSNVAKEDALSRVPNMDALIIHMPGSGGGKSNVTSNDGVVNYWRYLQD
jgi:hypothetical protein